MDPARLAARQKKVARRRATLVFVDETALYVNPTVRRTWALRGQTPTISPATRHYRHVSAIGALTVSPKRRRWRWLTRFHLDRAIRQQEMIRFLRDLLRHQRGPIVVLWDQLKIHRGRQVQKFVARHPRIALEHFPSYAPELNPVEYGWSHTKYSSLANYCPDDLHELHRTARRKLNALSKSQNLLAGFVAATRLPIRLAA
jgi:putative transposase